MITEIHIKNCKSIVDAAVKLSPFTLLIGANGSGKTTFLETLKVFRTMFSDGNKPFSIQKHVNYQNGEQYISFIKGATEFYKLWNDDGLIATEGKAFHGISNIDVFSINSSLIGEDEEITSFPHVEETGKGVVRVLDSLKTGDREDLFKKIETAFCQYIPEIEKLSFISLSKGKRLQVREKHLKTPLPLSLMSEGTKFILAILTIIYQEHPPTLIGIEDIDRGLHPRLFEKVIRVCREVTQQDNMPQIIATTHNLYIVDQFKDNEEAVIIVEKKHGETTFTPLSERIAHLEPEADDPLGELWFSGFVGGVPPKGV